MRYSRVVTRRSRVRFAHVVTRCLRASSVPLTHVARLAAHRSHVSRVSEARVTTSACDNKLLSLTNTHVNNVNLSGHIF
jgi:hypothetical protein